MIDSLKYMKRNFATLALFSLMTLCFSGLFAQSVSNTGSGVSDNSTAEEVLQRNIGEVSQFRGYTDGFQNAIKAGNVQLAQGNQVKLVGAMEGEILQGEAKGLNAESDKGLKSQKAILDFA